MTKNCLPGRKASNQTKNTAQNCCQPRIMSFGQAIMVNDTSELAVDRDFRSADGLGRQQVFACMVYD